VPEEREKNINKETRTEKEEADEKEKAGRAGEGRFILIRL